MISKAPVPFSRSDLDVLRFTSDANPPDQPRCTCVHLLSTLVDHITPTPMDFDSWAASLGVWHFSSTDVKESSGPVSSDPKNPSPSKAPNNEKNTRVSLTIPQLGRDVRSCCQNQCKEFADCLLSTSQWVALLTRYVDLVNKFIVSRPMFTLLHSSSSDVYEVIRNSVESSNCMPIYLSSLFFLRLVHWGSVYSCHLTAY